MNFFILRHIAELKLRQHYTTRIVKHTHTLLDDFPIEKKNSYFSICIVPVNDITKLAAVLFVLFDQRILLNRCTGTRFEIPIETKWETKESKKRQT